MTQRQRATLVQARHMAALATWWALLLVGVWTIVRGQPAYPSTGSRTIACEVHPWGYDEVRVEAANACGPVCGVEVRWVMYREDGARSRWTSGRGVEAWLDVLRDAAMYVEATIYDLNGERDARGLPPELGRCGTHFVYDGSVRREYHTATTTEPQQ